MATAEVAAADRSGRRFQFSLRQLFWAMGVACLLGGAYSWLRIELFLGLACLGSLLVGTYFAARPHSREALAVMICVLLFIAAFFTLFMPFVGTPREAARRTACSNNLHNLALALQNYHDVYGLFPPAYIADANGKPMHSWRVLILPFIEQKNLYALYRFDEPWDGPNNSKLHKIELPILLCPSQTGSRPQVETSYVAVVGPRTIWPDEKTTRISDIVDGASETLLIVECRNSGIHWMEPRDLDYVQMAPGINPPRGIGISSAHPTLVQAAFADGSVRAIDEDTPPATIRAMLTRNGREKAELP